ncbi:hypothetical protein CYFUS_002545 [Cystobacter fuscus]|uniref:FtsH ternary system domain-containing protein n=1 Tax=Cystobacter fuscus TaxID=43 RepID=A0A250IZH6_9BACT|nr:hypothetical protein [Cystobacter fuscus]ATB37124.1 hypothetical protein CYFUS_002545 [Cystobacter fuscus]
MPTLSFPTEEILRLALTSGLVPTEVQVARARVQRTGTGGLLVTPEAPLTRAQVKALGELGIRLDEQASGDGAAVSCWAELLPVRRMPDLDVPIGPVLFLAAHERELLPLAGELLRLGCDRQELCLAGSGSERRALLRAVAPPYFTLTRAIDRIAGLRAFAPVTAGSQGVWMELGHTHPMAQALRASPGTLLLLPGEGRWMTAPDGPWLDLYQLVDLPLPQPAEDWVPRPVPGRLSVPLRLRQAARVEPASLWVLRENAVAQVESLVHSLPEALLAQLRFAVSGPPEAPHVVLRARPGREKPPELGLSATAYAPLPQLPTLYLPCDALLEPPLRGDRLRALLTPDADTVTWLHPTGQGAFRAERLPERAFQPLDEWVEYVLDTGAVALEPWVRGATFDFAAFEGTDTGPSEESSPSAKEEEPGRRSSRRRSAAAPASEPIAAPRIPRAEAPRPPPMRLAPLTPARTSELERELTTREKDFLALESPADAPERLPAWVRMAELNGLLGRERDASLCWTRALWETSGAEAASLAARWAESTSQGASPTERLALAAPSDADVRALASHVLRVFHGSGEPLDVPAVQRWLDRHDGALDVRSLWLTRVALARLVGGDALGLAQAGDRVLALLHRGLSRSRDVPTFLRASVDAAHASRLRAQLDALLERFERTPRHRSALEAPVALTGSYVRFVFAWGLARLGHADRARELMASATSGLEGKDPVHGFLGRAYAARVAQALEGLPSETPLPHELATELHALGSFHRYKVDRLRQASTILEPSERLDPARSFGRGERDPRGEEFAVLREEKDVERLVTAVEQLAARALSLLTPAPERQRLLEGLLDTLPRLPPARALPLLARLVPSMEGLPDEAHALLLGDALTVAGHFGREDHVKALVGRLRALLVGLQPGAEAWGHGILGASLRDLRRLGLLREATGLLEPGQQLLARPEKVPLSTQLGIAAGLALLGHLPEATAVFERAFTTLARFQGPMPERLILTRGLAGALSQAPVDVALPALARLSEQLPGVTDSYNTNSHFCLSVVEFADALVLGHVGVGQGSGERARRWLDEDEFLVRRRIHRELEEHP